MALKKDWIVKIANGIEVVVKDAYCKVSKVEGDKNSIAATISVFKDATSDEAISVHIVTFKPSLHEDNFIAQAYSQFKTWPEFDGAKEC